MPISYCLGILFIGIFAVVFGRNLHIEILEEPIAQGKAMVVACVTIGIILIIFGLVGLICGIRS